MSVTPSPGGSPLADLPAEQVLWQAGALRALANKPERMAGIGFVN